MSWTTRRIGKFWRWDGSDDRLRQIQKGHAHPSLELYRSGPRPRCNLSMLSG
jgi:hypothetical protein